MTNKWIAIIVKDYQLALKMAKKKDKDPCWKGFEQAGTKKKEGKTVPNCIKSDKKNKK